MAGDPCICHGLIDGCNTILHCHHMVRTPFERVAQVYRSMVDDDATLDRRVTAMETYCDT